MRIRTKCLMCEVSTVQLPSFVSLLCDLRRVENRHHSIVVNVSVRHYQNLLEVTTPLLFDRELIDEYETCLFFEDGSWEVVDRYSTVVEARAGHLKQVKLAGG